MPNLVIWGAGGHASVVIDIARLSGWNVAACICDTDPGVATFLGVPVVDPVRGRELVGPNCDHAAVAIGNPAIRHRKAAILESWACSLPTLVHPSAVMSKYARLEAGTVVCAGAVVGPLAHLDRLCIVNTLASVDHECHLGQMVHVCPGARIAGKVTVGTGAWIGVGASIRDHLALGDWCMVGAGAAVVGDVQSGALVVGVPAIERGPSPFAPVSFAERRGFPTLLRTP